MPYSLILDVIVVGLLVIMIPYIMRLNNRLGMLRKDKAQLEKLAVTFSASTRRADESLGSLRLSAETMQRKLDAAQTLRDDLAFLLERGEKAADRLEDMIRQSRPETAALEAAAPKPAVPETRTETPPSKKKSATPPLKPGTDDESPRSEAERDLLKAIRSAN